MSDGLKPRIFKYDNVKLLAIILVVIGSFANEFTAQSDMLRSWFVFCSSFTAPLFVFLSGLFQKQYGKDRKPDIGKVSFYLLLGLLLKVLIYLARLLNGGDVSFSLLSDSWIEWYLFAIAGYMLLMYLLRGVNRYLMLALAVIIGVAAGFLPTGEYFSLMRFPVFLPFYVAGYWLSPIKVRRFTHRLNVKLAGVAFIFIYFIICFREREVIYPLRMLFTGEHPYAAVPTAGCTFWHRLLCYGISAVLIISVTACMPNRKFPVLTHMGRNTLGVYFWHYPILLLLWHFGVIDQIVALGDPTWKYLIIVAALLLALLLSLSVFTLPLRKLGELIARIPPTICLVADAVAVAAAITLQLTVL